MDDQHYEEIDELKQRLKERHGSWDTFKSLVDTIASNGAVCVDDLARMAGRQRRTMRIYMPLLQEYECIYRSRYKKKTWLVWATTQEATLCKRRRISLVIFKQLQPSMEVLREDFRRYYERRVFDNWKRPVETMEQIKQRWLKTLQPHCHPSMPLHSWRKRQSTHLTMRYIRTVQDLVLEELGLSRVFLNRISPTYASTCEEPAAVGSEKEEERMPKATKAQDAGHASTPAIKATEPQPRKVKKTAGELLAEMKPAKKNVAPKHKAKPKPRLSDYHHDQLPPQPPQRDVGGTDTTDIVSMKERVVKPGPDGGHKTIVCMVKGCTNERIVKNQDVFQAKRCMGHQLLYKKARRTKASKRRVAEMSVSKGKPRSKPKKEATAAV